MEPLFREKNQKNIKVVCLYVILSDILDDWWIGSNICELIFYYFCNFLSFVNSICVLLFPCYYSGM
jgi:hypothetical protein